MATFSGGRVTKLGLSATPSGHYVPGNIPLQLTPSVIPLSLGEYNPTVNRELNIPVSPTSLSISEQLAGVSAGRGVNPTVVSLSLTPANPTVNRELNIPVNAASLALSPVAADIGTAVTMRPDTITLTLSSERAGVGGPNRLQFEIQSRRTFLTMIPTRSHGRR